MSIIKENSFVKVDFTLKTKTGEIIDSSKEDGPLEFIYGKKRISSILEKAFLGKKEREEFTLVIEPEDGYGIRDENLVQFAKKELFGDDFNLIQVGMPLELENSDGELRVVMATEIRDDGIVIDSNHPLAGETLIYNLKILSVRDATEEELSL